MSVYEQFIESSKGVCVGRKQVIGDMNYHYRHFTRPLIDDQYQSRSEMMSRQKSRAHLAAAAAAATLSPLASAVGSTISSTPISKQQHYKRLIEASDVHCARVATDEIQLKNNSRNEQNYLKKLSSHSQARLSSLSSPTSLAAIQQQQQQWRASQANIYTTHPINLYNNRNNNCNQQKQQLQQNLQLQQWQQQQTNSKQIDNIYLQHNTRKHNLFKTDDPVLLKWMQAMRYETELECLTALQARTLAIDENSAAALSVRNSQVAIQEMRLESDLILDLIDLLIDSLPINFNTIDKFSTDFSELYVKLTEQTRAQHTSTTNNQNHAYCNQLSNLTIINSTPRKSLVSSRTLRPLDMLAVQIRNICIEMANIIEEYRGHYNSYEHIDNGQFEAMLRKIKELFGKFVEITIRAECANIVRALEHDFSKSTANLTKQGSNVSLRPVRPYESSSAQLPLKWALIAMWQLTKDDGYICRTLTEKWQTTVASTDPETHINSNNYSKQSSSEQGQARLQQKPRAAKRLDYSTKYDNDETNKIDDNNNINNGLPGKAIKNEQKHSLMSDYEKLYQICQNNEEFRERQSKLLASQHMQHQSNQENSITASNGALSSALKNKQPLRQVSTIELLIDIIISQPNKHERVDMMNFMQNNKLVDLEDLDQSVSAAFFTSNQYKVAALRILNHLCINEQAVKTILKCFSTPPPKQGHPIPENKIIKSIFECFQTAQEHIYQNETMFNVNRTPSRRSRKRARQQPNEFDCEEYSDYGSRQTSSVPTSESVGCDDNNCNDDGDDAVVKEAIRLLIQLTIPFYRSTKGRDYYILIGRFSIESLVKYLTNIIKSTSNREMLLLSLSALANISFITTEPMKQSGTNRIILEMFRASKERSKDLELRDQTVTILANTADKNLLDIISNGGLAFLLSSLEVCPTRMSNYRLLNDRLKQSDGVDHYSNIDDDADKCSLNSKKLQIENKPRDRKPIDLSDEFLDDLDCACDSRRTLSSMQTSCLSRLTVGEMAALERIHQKTAVAFARMSIDPSTTRMIEQYGGVKQMIDLCKLSHKRNNSYTVLIACLAALRKISKVIGCEPFKNYNALDLIELEPDQALEIYGRLYASEV